jgi:hypothetical protein
VREERRIGTDLDSLENFSGDFSINRLQNETDIGKEGHRKISGENRNLVVLFTKLILKLIHFDNLYR